MNRPKFRERGGLKRVVKYSKRVCHEAKPLTGRVLRVKDMKKITLGGALPQRGIKETHTRHFVVILDYGENYRMYNFNKTGELINWEDIEKNSDKIKLLLKSTKVEYKL